MKNLKPFLLFLVTSIILYSCKGTDSSSSTDTTSNSEPTETTDPNTEELSIEGPADSGLYQDTFKVNHNQNILSGSNGNDLDSISSIEVPSPYGTYIVDIGRSNCLNYDNKEKLIEEISQVLIRNHPDKFNKIQASILVGEGDSTYELLFEGSSQGNKFEFPRQNPWGEDSGEHDSKLTGEITKNGEVNMDISIFADDTIKCNLVLRKQTIQHRLNAGETPLRIVNSGVDVKELYGKKYAGGLIFFVDNENKYDFEGMVAATEDQRSQDVWGCYGVDIMGIMNVTECSGKPLIDIAIDGSCKQPLLEDTFEGARIGDGKANTDAILAECTTGKAAKVGIGTKLCRNLGAEWFLPSRGELNLMYTNLYKDGHGGFKVKYGSGYWSSTEYNSHRAWKQFFGDGEQSLNSKISLMNSFRAVRAF